MKKIRQRMYLLAFAALVLLFAACKGESPTAPTAPTPGGGTGTTPPVTAALTLTVSNETPLVDSTTIVTATVTSDGKPVANGTAVQFETTLGTFTDANAAFTIRTTTNGVATVTLTSSTAGTAKITATVANVSKTAQATFSLKPTTQPPPDTTPSITSMTPTVGRPSGGEIITITGKNFTAPVRVIFDYGNGVTKESQVVSVTSTQIQAITPPVDLGTGQTLDATVVVINNVGSPNEVRVTGQKFTYQATVLTPKVTTISPTSGPIDGGTRVTIFGEGFQAPLQVFFGSAEAQVINVTFSQIVVMSPSGRDTATDGSGAVTGPVDLKIVNINSATTVTAADAFRYTPKMQITAMGPTEGLFTGGTRVTIDGVGFVDPVAVVIGGVAAQPIKVTGTQIIAVTSGVALSSCGDVTGPSTVTNVDNGDSATGVPFIYRVPKPIIVSVSPNPGTAGGSISVVVANAIGFPRLTVGGTALSITAATTNADTGLSTLTAIVPTNLQLATQPCADVSGVTVQIPTAFDVTYESGTTGCTNTLPKGLVINPQAVPKISILPATFTPFTAKFSPATFTTTTDPITGAQTINWTKEASITPSQPQVMTIVNSGFAPLTITSITAAGCTNFSVKPPPGMPVTLTNTCDSVPYSVSYNPPQPAGAHDLAYPPTSESCSITINTNAGVKTISVTGSVQ